MSNARLSSTRGGSALALPQALTMYAHGEPPLRVFRHVCYLRFQTSGATHLRLLETTSAQLRFDVLHYDALASSAPGGAGSKANAGSGFVRITLPVPRRVRQVEAAGKLQLRESGHDLVLNGKSNGFAKSAPVGGVRDEDTVIGVRLTVARPIALHRVDGNAIAEQATVEGHLGAVLTAAFVDANFAVAALDDDALTAGQIGAIEVSGFPTGARLGVAALAADGTLLEPPVFAWSEPGEVDDTTGRLPLAADASTPLREALQRLLDAALEDGPRDTVDVALVIESDAPCASTLQQLALPYLLGYEAFAAADATDKATLRFAGARTETQRLSVELPGAALVRSATLRVETALGAAEPAAFGADPRGALSLATGAYLATTHWVAQTIQPPAPIAVSALALGLLALAAKTELSVELRADWRGGPAGALIVARILTLELAGRSGWYRLPLADTVVLDSTRYWLRIKATRGTGVWLASTPLELGEDTNAAPGDGAVRVIRAGTVLISLASHLGAAGVAARLTLAGVAVQPAESSADGQRYELATVLAQLMAAGPTAPTRSFELAFTAAQRGVVTVYPPAIEYELAG